jgi:hypothetical protein
MPKKIITRRKANLVKRYLIQYKVWINPDKYNHLPRLYDNVLNIHFELLKYYHRERIDRINYQLRQK